MNGFTPILLRFSLHSIISPLADQGNSEERLQMNQKNQHKATRKGGTVTCARCLTLGHNFKVCTLTFHPKSRMKKTNNKESIAQSTQSDICTRHPVKPNHMPQNLQTKGQSSQGTANATTTLEIPNQPKSSSQPNPTPTLSTM